MIFELILITFFALSTCAQLGYGLFFLIASLKLKARKAPKEREPLPISVIVAAKNEEKNINRLLGGLLSQDYPCFQVVVVSDRSTDGTNALLKKWQKKYPLLLKILLLADCPEGVNGKKNALARGMALAEYPFFLLTDADCKPISKKWIYLMQQAYHSRNQIVLGYGGYKKFPGLLNGFIRYETFFTAWLYMGYGIFGQAYMGVGRNLLYSKSIFDKAKGFEGTWKTVGGDDDLFVQKNRRLTKAAIVFEKNAQTVSIPKNNIKDWFYQKLRHLAVGKKYSAGIKWGLGVFHASHIVFYLMPFAVLFKFNFILLFAIYIFRLALYFSAAVVFRKKLEVERDLLVYFPLYDILFFIYFVVLGSVAFFNKRNRWN